MCVKKKCKCYVYYISCALKAIVVIIIMMCFRHHTCEKPLFLSSLWCAFDTIHVKSHCFYHHYDVLLTLYISKVIVVIIIMMCFRHHTCAQPLFLSSLWCAFDTIHVKSHCCYHYYDVLLTPYMCTAIVFIIIMMCFWHHTCKKPLFLSSLWCAFDTIHVKSHCCYHHYDVLSTPYMGTAIVVIIIMMCFWHHTCKKPLLLSSL